MKQVVQSLKSGKISIEDTPSPNLKSKHVLIRTKNSILSSGTERMLLDFGKSNYLNKALKNPKRVEQLLNKVKNDGLIDAITTVRSKLDMPIPLGYCSCGEVIESKSDYFTVGDRVISNGPHAEIVSVPQNLCAKIPDGVDYENASFTVLAAISLQGIRISNIEIGESVAVYGLGLIGLITCKILLANGCEVVGIDNDKSKCEFARKLGIPVVDTSKDANPILRCQKLTSNLFFDKVLITVNTTSNDVIKYSSQLCRKKGKITLIGVTGLNIDRDDFYKKEIIFQVSCSYGPGRYDPEYELFGNDYPIEYVRWTENRNFQTILNLLSAGKIDFTDLVSHQISFEDALKAYEILLNKPSISIILNYDKSKKNKIKKTIAIKSKIKSGKTSNILVGLIGSGSYTKKIILPTLKKIRYKYGINLNTIVSNSGITGTIIGKKYFFENSSSSYDSVTNSKKINTVIIASNHDTHAEIVLECIKKNKNIFVEKPLGLNESELVQIKKLYSRRTALGNYKSNFMVGFNRRFSPHIIKIKEALKLKEGQNNLIYTVNAGHIDKESWLNQVNQGGRVVGEVCHFVDTINFLYSSEVTSISKLTLSNNKSEINNDYAISLKYQNGSIATIHYFANGAKSYPKENIKIINSGGMIELDNFKHTKFYNWPNFSNFRTIQQDKGNRECLNAFFKSVYLRAQSPISFDDLYHSSLITDQIANI